MNRVRAVLTALRGFARGFVGITTPPPRDAGAARAQLRQAAEHRPHCC
jgi:hypothetical protein